MAPPVRRALYYKGPGAQRAGGADMYGRYGNSGGARNQGALRAARCLLVAWIVREISPDMQVEDVLAQLAGQTSPMFFPGLG